MNDIYTLGKVMRDAQRAHHDQTPLPERLAAMRAAEAAFDAALAAPFASVDRFEEIRAAYIRGADWMKENPDAREYLPKAAFDYADKALAAPPAARGDMDGLIADAREEANAVEKGGPLWGVDTTSKLLRKCADALAAMQATVAGLNNDCLRLHREKMEHFDARIAAQARIDALTEALTEIERRMELASGWLHNSSQWKVERWDRRQTVWEFVFHPARAALKGGE